MHACRSTLEDPTLGTRERTEFTVIGHAVNLAARLEESAGAGQILLSPETASRIGGGFKTKAAGPLKLSGIEGDVAAVELLG